MALYDCLTVVLSGMPNQGRGERLSILSSVAAGTPHISFIESQNPWLNLGEPQNASRYHVVST